jgi:hypothetical protein
MTVHHLRQPRPYDWAADDLDRVRMAANIIFAYCTADDAPQCVKDAAELIKQKGLQR